MGIFNIGSGDAPRYGAPLPKNRRQLFRDVLKVRFFSLIGLNLLYILIWIPAALWSGYNLLSMLIAKDMHELTGIFMWWLIILCPLIGITGPFEMGVAYVSRNWARDQHAFVRADFKEGMKNNWKQGLLYSILSGLVYMLCGVAIIYYLSQAKNSPVYYLPMVITFTVLLMWSLSALSVPTIIVSYKLSMKDILKNGLILTIAELPKALALRIVTIIIPVIAVVIALTVDQSAIPTVSFTAALYACIVPAFNKLLAAAFSNMACEKYINPGIEGAPVNVGLYPGNEPEDEEDDEIEV